mmetsp:Transcript_17340/g.37414  ORF Transcript_17340/g.37414 Transcript_17340/m.37414 type:complete len:337 (+) Transcript_17340:974-1984(+)
MPPRAFSKLLALGGGTPLPGGAGLCLGDGNKGAAQHRSSRLPPESPRCSAEVISTCSFSAAWVKVLNMGAGAPASAGGTQCVPAPRGVSAAAPWSPATFICARATLTPRCSGVGPRLSAAARLGGLGVLGPRKRMASWMACWNPRDSVRPMEAVWAAAKVDARDDPLGGGGWSWLPSCPPLLERMSVYWLASLSILAPRGSDNTVPMIPRRLGLRISPACLNQSDAAVDDCDLSISSISCIASSLIDFTFPRVGREAGAGGMLFLARYSVNNDEDPCGRPAGPRRPCWRLCRVFRFASAASMQAFCAFSFNKISMAISRDMPLGPRTVAASIDASR